LTIDHINKEIELNMPALVGIFFACLCLRSPTKNRSF